MNTKNIPSDLLEILRISVNRNIEEYSVEFEDFDGKGEGFLGEVLFVTLTNKKSEDKQCLVIKQLKSVNGVPLKYLITPFKNEIHFYNNIWPTLHDNYKEVTGKSAKLVPKCLGIISSEVKILALENLKTGGYEAYDKRKPLNDEHFSQIFETFGFYHGISMALREQNQEEFNKLVDPLSPFDEGSYTNSYIARFLKYISHEFQEMFEEENEGDLIEKLKLYEESGPKLVEDSTKEGKLDGVILHGDCWSNNYMFKYDASGRLRDIKLIDFQLVSKGSPVLDLSYCFYSGGSAESFEKLNHYLEIYHSSLTKTLKEFGLEAEEIYSFKELQNEWKKYCKYGYGMGVMLWNMKLAQKDAMENINKTSILFKMTEESHQLYRQRIKELIRHMHENNFW